MASLIDISDLTLNPEEAHEIGQLIIERAFVDGPLSDDHDMVTGILYKQQIPFAGRIADSLKKAVDCTPNPGTGVELTEKFWDPEIYDSRWEHCAADLDKLFKLFKKAKRINPDFYDLIDSEAMGVIYALIEQMLVETLPIKVWFSDKAADHFADGGVFTAGTDLDLYNVIDGLWKQIFAEATTANRVTITKNAAESYALQALAADEALTIFTAMFTKADPRLAAEADRELLVTRSLYENYMQTLETKTIANGYTERTENGEPKVYFRGVEVKPKYEWDRIINASQNNGTKWNMPHRAVLTTPGNIPVATLATEDLSQLDAFYDRYRKTNVIDVAFSLDTKMLENYMIVSAY
jgi:hypothetical protein